MTFALRNSALVVVLCAAFAIPAVVYGADPELEAQLRTVLSESAAQEGISAGELAGKLSGIATALNKPEKEDKAVADAIKESARASQAVADAIKNIPQPKTPDVKVQISQQEIVTSLEGICKRIEDSNKAVVEAMGKKLYVDKFKIRNMGGGTHEADVFYKPLKEVIIKK
jgi:hypothetical protein